MRAGGRGAAAVSGGSDRETWSKGPALPGGPAPQRSSGRSRLQPSVKGESSSGLTVRKGLVLRGGGGGAAWEREAVFTLVAVDVRN